MALMLSYNLRHLTARKTTAAMTLLGVALVVFVFVATQMMSNGLQRTLAGTGSDANVIIIRTGAENEIQSGITRNEAAVVLSYPEVERTGGNLPLSSSDTVVVIALQKRSGGGISNVTVRGTGEFGLQVREGLKVMEGRFPARGTQELMVGTAVRERFSGTNIGDSVRMVGTDWPVVGVFDAGNSGFSSEIWGDADILMPSFKRDAFSSITFRLGKSGTTEAVRERISKDKRLTLSAKVERQFYEDQSKMLATFIRVLGTLVSVVFSLGAILGAMITMYSSVSNRVREIGMLRAIGFSRQAVFLAFVTESMLIGLLGGLGAVALASLLSFLTVSTTNFQTFAVVAFGFRLSPQIAAEGLLFAVTMGALGGALPAFRASRLKILDAVREG